MTPETFTLPITPELAVGAAVAVFVAVSIALVASAAWVLWTWDR